MSFPSRGTFSVEKTFSTSTKEPKRENFQRKSEHSLVRRPRREGEEGIPVKNLTKHEAAEGGREPKRGVPSIGEKRRGGKKEGENNWRVGEVLPFRGTSEESWGVGVSNRPGDLSVKGG